MTIEFGVGIYEYKISLVIAVGIIVALALFSYNKVKSLERVLEYNQAFTIK